eukprot:gene16216-11602_t
MAMAMAMRGHVGGPTGQAQFDEVFAAAGSDIVNGASAEETAGRG